jgi:lipopolysaccharide/colanic/teichoic acid biosynthesis glycosyltransferase
MTTLTKLERLSKRTFDIILASIGLLLCWWLILLAFISAAIDTRSNGFFIQIRVGRNGRLFKVVKIKTMKPSNTLKTTVTTSNDSRITKLGAFLRKTKIDELPQLINVFLGQMSFVGPRPDVPGFADQLQGNEKLILSIRPGITGPATLQYRNEEELLAQQADPETYNREVIFPDKVRINLEYIQHWSLLTDLKYIFKTVLG